MIRIFFFLLSFGISSMTYCQNLTITGKVYMDVYNQYTRKSDTIYYTFMGQKFNKQSFILIQKDDTYTFSIPLSKIKKRKIKTLVFTQNINSSSINDFACTHKININKIPGTRILSKENTEIISDLLLLENCCERMGRDTKENDKKYVGTYQPEDDENIQSITLDSGYGCRLIYRRMSDNLITEERGSWKYDEINQKIILITWKQENPEIGITILKDGKYIFNIFEKEAIIKLETNTEN